MMPTLICGGLSFQNTPVEIREQVAFRDMLLPGALCRLRLQLQLDEAALLSTCNRVEYFGLTQNRDHAAREWPEFLRNFHSVNLDVTPYSFHLGPREAVEHLFATASGLESMVIGETEILGQLKGAYSLAARQGLTQKWLNRLFQSSFAAAKAVRSSTSITRGSVSVGSVAVDLAEKLFGNLSGRTVMILGAGSTSERTARALQSHGIHALFVANRTHDKAAQLAADLGGFAIHWDQFETNLAHVDIVISSTAAPHYILTKEKLAPLLRSRSGRPLFLIDLAVPRDIEPALNFLDDVYVYDIDDLHAISRQNQAGRSAEIDRCRRILTPHVDKFMRWAEQQSSLHPTHPAPVCRLA